MDVRCPPPRHRPRRSGLAPLHILLPLLGVLLSLQPTLVAQNTPGRFTVASYNLENYLLADIQTRTAKAPESRARVLDALLAIRPDILAVQEIGDTNALLDLQAGLRARGLDLPHWEHVRGYDPVIFVGVLSRHPIVARRSHTNASFLVNGRRFRTSRGFAEVDIQPAPNYRFTLFTAHLKSKRPMASADEAEVRHQEAIVLRRLIEERLTRDPQANILVCGDFNDSPASPAIRTLIGRGRRALVDTRPAERNGDTLPAERPGWRPRNVAWTHFYGTEDLYSRIDYILLSPGMAREWRAEGSYVLALPNWGLASDHRPLVAEFTIGDR